MIIIINNNNDTQKTLTILGAAWCKHENILPDSTAWYKVRWEQGRMLENEGKKILNVKLRKEEKRRETRLP